MRRTALYDVHRRPGASTTCSAVREMPPRYGSDVKKSLGKVASAVDVRGIHEAAGIVQLPFSQR